MSTNPVSELNTLLKETFGEGHHGSIARAPMFGHDDNCWIISGPKAETAANMLAARFKGSVEKSVSTFMSVTRTNFVLTFPVIA